MPAPKEVAAAKQRLWTTWEWWGWPKYGWRFRIYKDRDSALDTSSEMGSLPDTKEGRSASPEYDQSSGAALGPSGSSLSRANEKAAAPDVAWENQPWQHEPGHDMGNHFTRDTHCALCGEDHPERDGKTSQAKLALWDEPGYWSPISEGDLDELYLEAWLGHDHG